MIAIIQRRSVGSCAATAIACAMTAAVAQPTSTPVDPTVTVFDVHDVELWTQTRNAAPNAAPGNRLAVYFDGALIASLGSPPPQGRVAALQRTISMTHAAFLNVRTVEVASWGPACAPTLNIPDSFYWGPRSALLIGRIGYDRVTVRRDVLGVAFRFRPTAQKVWEPNPDSSNCPAPITPVGSSGSSGGAGSSGSSGTPSAVSVTGIPGVRHRLSLEKVLPLDNQTGLTDFALTIYTTVSTPSTGHTQSAGPLELLIHSGAADDPRLLYQSTLPTVASQQVAAQNEMYMFHFSLPSGLSVRKDNLRSVCILNRGDDNWHPGSLALFGWGRDAANVLRGSQVAANSWTADDRSAWVGQDSEIGTGVGPAKQYACLKIT